MESEAAQENRASGLTGEVQQTFRSLRHRNFRIYFFGQAISLCGTWMQGLALSWLVYRMTNSAFLLGLVEFANLFPVLLLALVGGWVADKVERKKVLAVAQMCAMIQATILAVLTLNGKIEVWQILCLSAVAGTVNAFEIPSRQALLVQMVDRKDLVNAISLNSSLFNGSRVIGPALAALLIGFNGEGLKQFMPSLVNFSGEGVCFAINAVSYLASFAAVLMLQVPATAADTNKKQTSIIEGLKYSFTTPSVRRIMRLTALLSLFGGQFTVLLPVVTKQVLHLDVGGFGALRTAAAVGSLTAALLLASRGSGDMLGKGVGYANLFFGLVLFIFAFSQNFYLSMATVVFLGFAMTFQLSGSHSLLQLDVPDELRGRLMSVWTIMIMGLSPLGSLLVGWLASHYGAPPALLICAVVSTFSALMYIIFRR